jgi:hypothetical protein
MKIIVVKKRLRFASIVILILLVVMMAGLPVQTFAVSDGDSDVVFMTTKYYARNTTNASKAGKADPGYKLMGVTWDISASPVTYSVNADSLPAGLDHGVVIEALEASAETWDGVTSKELFAAPQANSSLKYGVRDSKNAIVFGPYSGGSSVIAVTAIWYNNRTKRILEFDMQFNTFYRWDLADAAGVYMDIQNIATHEFGHSVGLSDIYSSSYSEVTMYGYADYNQINKISLETPDILGLQKMYGQ